MDNIEDMPKENVHEVDENNSMKEPIKTIKHNQENMDAYKQTIHETLKKKWSKYFLQFLMIFLAVFLGYYSENFRESIAERNRGKQYLDAYKNDLLQNKVTYKTYDSLFMQLMPVYDSIATIYHEQKENEELQSLARLLALGKRTINVPLSTTNYFQMVNSGSIRLIENKYITVEMSKYNDAIIGFKDFDIQLKGVRGNIYHEVLKIEDLHDFFQFDENGSPIKGYVPNMDKFPVLSIEQRRVLVNYYKLYISQTRTELNSLRELSKTNNKLLDLIEKN
jgi:hypothetical protein